MGVGDRHSKRAAAEKAKAQSSPQRAFEVDDRELDDAFSAWDDDDAGAQKSARAQATASSSARTSVERKIVPLRPGAAGAPGAPGAATATPATPATPAAATAAPAASAQGSSPRPALGDALVDPVAMRDIVISRARTLDDPLTTRVLAEIARSEATNDRGRRGPLPQRTRTLPEAVKVAPPKILAAPAAPAAANARSGERTAARSPDMIAAESPKPASAHTSDEVAVPRGPTRRGLARDEPFRKK